MKKLLSILISAAAMLTACSGASDDEPDQLALEADVTTIEANGKDAVTFTAKLNGVECTADAKIICTDNDVAELEGNTFSTTAPGRYTFVATVGETTSNAVVITADPVETSPYERQVCAMEFTGAWCTMCPQGMTKLRTVIEKDDLLNGRVHVMAFHDNSMGADPMAIAETSLLCDRFGVDAFPHLVTDMRERVDLTSPSKDIKASFYRSIEEHPAKCGVRMTSVMEGNIANIAVTFKAAKAATLSLALYVVEDKIIGTQKDGSLVRDDYLHRHVVRKLISSSVLGDKLGNFAPEQEITVNYEAEISSEWNTDNLEVYALALDADGCVTNMATCAAKEGSADYILAQQ